MSIDLNWETLTGGPDGAALAERIRDFIHTKFQSVPLPRFIKSVTVHDFAFGTIPPSVVLKDICDPLPDFYEENPDVPDDEEDDDEDDDESKDNGDGSRMGHGGGGGVNAEDVSDAIRAAERRRRADQIRRLEGRGGNGRRGGPGNGTGSYPEGLYPPHIHVAGLRSGPGTPDIGTPFLGLGMPTPGVPGGTANMHYFQSKLATTWSGTQTPLAAVAGAQHLNGWLEMGGAGPHSPPRRYPSPNHHSRSRGHSRNPSQSSISATDFPSPIPSSPSPIPASLAPLQHPLREKHSVSTLAPTSAGPSRPPTRDASSGTHPHPHFSGSSAFRGGANESAIIDDGGVDSGEDNAEDEEEEEDKKFQEPRVDDLQAVFRIKYAGDVKLMLTAEILLDYPMPSFVGIPVRLHITGLTFDGVGVVAYIRKRVHFCFLSPEDALAAVGQDDDEEEDDAAGAGAGSAAAAAAGGGGGGSAHTQRRGGLGSLLQEVRVESEIGQREGSKQSLKNVGKVEKFVLEQVRRIFEEEFVYPSFWTFLV
ncbi:Mitochondrial distribution and morphology protein 12 [Hypoxylon texense]